MLPPWPVALLWITALTGWGLVGAGLTHGMTGRARRVTLLMHALTLPGIILRSSIVGAGLLVTMIPATAGWWALLMVTGFRPERLVDPARGGLGRLAAWLVVGALLSVGTQSAVLS